MHMITLREYGEIRYNPILLHYTENGCVADQYNPTIYNTDSYFRRMTTGKLLWS